MLSGTVEKEAREAALAAAEAAAAEAEAELVEAVSAAAAEVAAEEAAAATTLPSSFEDVPMDVPLGMTDGLGDGAATDDELQDMKAQRTRKHARLAAFGWDGADHPRVGSLVPPPSAKLPERDSRKRRRRRRGGPLYVVGRSMFETDGIPGDWAEKCNEWVDEVWLPSEFNRQTFAAHGVDEARLQLMPQPLDLKLFDADAVTPAVLPHRPRFAFLSVFKWEKRKGWDALFAAFLREFTASEDVALFLRVSTDDGNKQELADALHAELCRLADDATTEADAAADAEDADAAADAAEAPEPTIAVARAAVAPRAALPPPPPLTPADFLLHLRPPPELTPPPPLPPPRDTPPPPPVAPVTLPRAWSRWFAASGHASSPTGAAPPRSPPHTPPPPSPPPDPPPAPPSAEPPAPPAADDADDGDGDEGDDVGGACDGGECWRAPDGWVPGDSSRVWAREGFPTVVLLDEMLPGGELPGLYAAVDAFVLPSRGEGVGAAGGGGDGDGCPRDRHQLVRDHRLPRRRSRLPAAVHAPARAARRRSDVG